MTRGKRTRAGGNTGNWMYALMEELYPICRSITGNGVRETLQILRNHIDLQVYEVPSGTPVFDWVVPREWNIRDAYIRNGAGEKVADFARNNLHVLNYSIPVRATMDLEELRPHLHTLPEYPNWIPYLTSYYHENWGFCLTQNQHDTLAPGKYEVVIDSTLEPGALTYGEYFLPGRSDQEVVLTTYLCHPSLANDNLSGVVLLMALAQEIARAPRRFSYRFLFVPETIGAITWLSRNEARVQSIRCGLVATCAGDPGPSTYQRSRRGNAEIDRIAELVLRDSGAKYRIRDFIPYGSDERQFSSPGFDLPFGSLMRTPYGEYPEYHTSADNLAFVRPECLEDSLGKYLAILQTIEANRRYRNMNPKCEPQLGKRGLYGPIGSRKDPYLNEYALLWTLNLSDGSASLVDIAIRSGVPFSQILRAAEALSSQGLLAPVGDEDSSLDTTGFR